jgi:hypothetical protein
MSESLPSSVARLFRDRRALLWVCQGYDLHPDEASHDYDLAWSQAALRYRAESGQTDRDVASYYWEAVWLEGTASPLLPPLREVAAGSGVGARQVVILAGEDDAGAQLSSREFLPVSVLPGVLDSTLPPPARYGAVKGRMRERTAWALASRLEQYRDRALVVLGARTQADLKRLFEVIEDRPVLDLRVLLVWPEGEPLPEPPANASVELHPWRGTAEELLTALAEAGAPAATDIPRWSVRVGQRGVELSARDVDRILTRFVLLTEQDIAPMPVFTMDNLLAFLSGSVDDWSAYGVGLPVDRSYRTQRMSLPEQTLATLRQVQRDPGRGSTFLIRLPAEPGAGVTTLLRSAAFAAAREGFPALVLRPEQVEVDQEDLSTFATTLSEASLTAGFESMPPLLIVLDVDHDQRGIPASGLLGTLAAQGRPAVALQAVAAEEASEEVERRTDRLARLPVLRARLKDDEVERCERTLSQITERWGLSMEVPSVDQWRRYETATRWPLHEDGRTSSLFWVALRFFLTEGMSLTDAEQAHSLLGTWIIRRTEQIDDDSIRQAVTYVAAMSTFRLPSPMWTVLRPAVGGIYSAGLSVAMRQLDGIVVWDGPVKGLDEDVLRFLHPALAEAYLQQQVGARSAAERIGVLAPVLAALSPGSPADIWVAEALAKDVLTPKYEERSSADWAWRLESFELIPPSIRDQSKTLLHHWARSLYLSTDPRNAPSLALEERRARFERAIEKLARATALPRRPGRDEHPSHLYNTLGTAYYRLSRVLEEAGKPSEAAESWVKACAAFQEAIDLSGGINVEALLAFSQRLLAHARGRMPDEQAVKANELTQALGLLDDADDLVGNYAAPDPEWLDHIVEYRAEALRLLSEDLGDAYVDTLIESADPELGYYCKARLALLDGEDAGAIDRALAILEEAQEQGVELGPRSIRLRIRLLERRPVVERDFGLLKELYQQLEAKLQDTVRPLDLFRHAVLSYQTGSYLEGAERFRRLRAQFRSQDIPAIRMYDVWRNPDAPEQVRLTQMRVDRMITDWRAEGYLLELHQTVPFRPRHFSPPPHRGEIVACAVRFESNGPLAVPPRFVESRQTARRSRIPGGQ